MNTNICYSPEPETDFYCKVPLTTTEQLMVVNGICKNANAVAHKGLSVISGDHKKGVVLTLAAETVMEKPMQIINMRNEENTAEIAYTNTFVVEKNAYLKLLICNHTHSSDAFTTQSTTNIVLKENAQLEIVWMQSEHNQSQHQSVINVQQAEKSRFFGNIITLHGAKIENLVNIKLQGEYAECVANGLFLIDRQQRYSTDITITHETGNCQSKQLFKGVLDEQAIGQFQGRVIVAKDAQKTEAYQANNNLLLTRQAKMFTQPQLEIYADDVKCSHGATIGQLDEQALFYLRSRGISLKEARLLQQIGFVQDVIDKIDIEPLRNRIAGLVSKRLSGEFSRCADCESHCC